LESILGSIEEKIPPVDPDFFFFPGSNKKMKRGWEVVVGYRCRFEELDNLSIFNPKK
jgi:hypothetical protein